MNAIPASGYEPPQRYGKDMLQLLVRDAHTLFAYWEISDRIRLLATRHFECDYGALPKVLRIYDVTDIYFNGSNAHRARDIETSPEADRWTIHGLNAGATYVADFGTYTLGRRFVPLLRSLPAETPRDTESPPWGTASVPLVAEALYGEAVSPARIPQHFFENMTYFSESDHREV